MSADLGAFFPHQPLGAPFPFLIDPPTLFHARGQLTRASTVWLAMDLQARHRAGADGPYLAALCALLALHPGRKASDLLRWAGHLDPSAMDAFVKPDAAKPVLAALGLAFERAAVDWVPPQDPALRGWSKTYLDEEVQAQSRERFAALARQCFEWADAGLPAALDELALRQEGELFKDRAVPRNALDILALLAQERPGAGVGFLGPQSDAVCAAAADAMAPKKFRAAMEARALALGMDRAGLAASMGRAMRQGAAPSRRVAQLKYCAQWCASVGEPALLRPLFESALGAPFDEPKACHDAWAALASQAKSRTLDLVRCGLGLSQAMDASGSALEPSQALAGLMWGAHLDRFPTLGKERRVKLFTAQHIALCKRFPHPALAAASLGKAPPAAAAAIEASLIQQELDEMLAFAPASPWGALDGGEPAEPPRPRPRL